MKTRQLARVLGVVALAASVSVAGVTVGGAPAVQAAASETLDGVTATQTYVSQTPHTATADGTVTYSVVVEYPGPGPEVQYSLIGYPDFDGNIVPTLSSSTTDAPGGTPQTADPNIEDLIPADDQSISPGETHTYTLVYSFVHPDLFDMTIGPDPMAEPCNGNGGNGLFAGTVFSIGDSEVEIDACADLEIGLLDIAKNPSSISGPDPDGLYEVSYDITVENYGTGSQNYSLIEDPQFDTDIEIVSAELTAYPDVSTPAVSWVPTDGDWYLTAVNGSPSYIDIPAGQTHTYTVAFVVDASAILADPSLNSILVGPSDPRPFDSETALNNVVRYDWVQDGNTYEFGGFELTTDVAIEKVVSGDQTVFNPGDSVMYQLSVINNGPETAETVTVSDVLPDGLSVSAVSSGDASCEMVDSSTVTCDLGNLPPGVPVIVDITANIADDAQLGSAVNTASVSTSSEETNSDNNSDEAEITIEVVVPTTTTTTTTSTTTTTTLAPPTTTTAPPGTLPTEPEDTTTTTAPVVTVAPTTTIGDVSPPVTVLPETGSDSTTSISMLAGVVLLSGVAMVLVATTRRRGSTPS